MSDTLQTVTDIDNFEIARTIECDSNELFKHIVVKKSDLTIFSQNIRSIYCNFDDFLLTLSTVNFESDIIIFTECRLNSNKPIPLLNNYSSYMTSSQLNQNDGVVVYVKSALEHRVTEVSLSQASCLSLEILNNVILCIYRSPSNSNTDSFVSSLNDYLETITPNKNIIVAGDININIIPKLIEQSHELSNRTNYLNMLSLHGILPGHQLPTRDKSCLDHFMLKVNKKKFSPTIAILNTTVTDHYTTLLVLSKQKCLQNIRKTKTFVDFDQALHYLKEKNLSELLFCDDPDSLCTLLIQTLADSIKLNTITLKIPSKKRILKPWITNGILRCIQNRNKLQNKLRLDQTNEILKITYRRYRNHCNNLIKKLKRQYERNLLSKSVHNNKLLWKNIKAITYSQKTNNCDAELLKLQPTPSDSVNFINNYFSKIGQDLAQQISTTTGNQAFGQSSNASNLVNSFVLLETDPEEVYRILINLKADSAPGWDNISTKFLKFVGMEVVPIIAHLANLCFKTGIFPDPLKIAIITPVHKGGGSDDINNYRPISVLTSISKIIEKLINARLLNYLNKFNIISDSQFGFRQGISTEDAVISLTSSVANHLDNGDKCLTVFLDLRKAFDTVSAPILVSKLEKVGIRDIALDLFKSYLSNRKQSVKVGQHISDVTDVSYGVPQGSVLGPTLFLLYINDLCKMKIPNAKVLSYADDTAVIFCGRTWHDVRLSAETGMSLVANWLNANVLTLNTSKTNFISFSICNRTQPTGDFRITIHTCDGTNVDNCNCSSIGKVSSTKYLGVMLDQRLCWYPHLEQVANRVRKLNWIFKTLRHVLPRSIPSSGKPGGNVLTQIYISLAQSILLYCIPVWGGAAKSKFIQLERAQRALLKIMHFKKRRYSTENLYKLSDVLSVRKLYITQTTLKKHKTLPYNSDIHSKRRKHNIVQIPKTKTNFGSMQFSKRSAQLYNKINKEIFVYAKSYHLCKKLLIDWIKPLSYQNTEALLQNVT